MNRTLILHWVALPLTLVAGITVILLWYWLYASPKMTVPAAASPLGSTTFIPQSSDIVAATLQANIAQAFTQFDESLSQDDMPSAETTLTTLSSYQPQILSLLPKISTDRKKSLAEIYSKHIEAFEANLHILPEHAQMDGMVILAGYQTIMDYPK